MTRHHAVVIGASISGLLAARVLSERFERVTVIDRDALPSGDEQRLGVPQGHHGHGLLASGLSSLKQLFPQLEEELVAAGALPGDVIGDVRWYQHGHYKAKFPSGFAGLLLSRPMLEATVRRNVRRIPNVRIVDTCHVAGLLTDGPRHRAIVGVRLRNERGQVGRLEACLVVDASGRGSATPKWLGQLGYAPPDDESVAIDFSYTTRTFARRSTDLGGDVGAIIAPLPPLERRVGFMLAMEGGRWIVTLGGWLGERAPGDQAGFVEFARSLPRPDIFEVIKDATPLTNAAVYHFASNLRRRYERLSQFPENYLVIGDALCSFNPIYGQGMSVAALEALVLERCLGESSSRRPLWQRFFRQTAQIIDTPWMIASGSDFAFTGVTGAKPAGTDLINWYLERIHRVASTDRQLCRQFFDVANLLKPATTLFRPTVLARVARGCLLSPANSPAAPAPPGDAPTFSISRRNDTPARGIDVKPGGAPAR